jgi:hypothetical protein
LTPRALRAYRRPFDVVLIDLNHRVIVRPASPGPRSVMNGLGDSRSMPVRPFAESNVIAAAHHKPGEHHLPHAISVT